MPQVKILDPWPSLLAQDWSGGSYSLPFSIRDVLMQDEGRDGVIFAGGIMELVIFSGGGSSVETVILLETLQIR